MRYKVTVKETRQETYTHYVEAPDEATAEIETEEAISEGYVTGEDEGIESSVSFEVVDPNAPHEVINGTDGANQICQVCGRPIVWTGLNYDNPRNLTGKTIPGPWIHESDATRGEGFALEASENFYRPEDWSE